jgi:hypothetical protein
MHDARLSVVDFDKLDVHHGPIRTDHGAPRLKPAPGQGRT